VRAFRVGRGPHPERREQRDSIVGAAQSVERLAEQLTVAATTQPAQARWIDVHDARSVVHQHRPRKIVRGAGKTAQHEIVHDHAQVAQARRFGARQIDVALTI
jgi:hypothetical protein